MDVQDSSKTYVEKVSKIYTCLMKMLEEIKVSIEEMKNNVKYLTISDDET